MYIIDTYIECTHNENMLKNITANTEDVGTEYEKKELNINYKKT